MDNQHKLIKGYRDLSENEIGVINSLKETEANLGTLLKGVDRIARQSDEDAVRWAAMAREYLEIGMMMAIKAVAQPTNGLGEGSVMARDYKSEYKNFHSKPGEMKKRAARNAARAEMVKEGKATKGDGKDVDHKVPFAKGGGKGKSNLRMVSASANRSFPRTPGAKMK